MAHVTSRDGTRIGYERRGNGPLVITVAGATQYRAIDPDGTPALADQLATDFSVVIYDRRGRGESGDTAPYAVAREIDDIEALIDAEGGDTAFLFGMSSGAVLALEAMAALPHKIGGAVLYEPPLDPAAGSEVYQRQHAEMAALAEGAAPGAMLESFMTGVGMPADELKAFRDGPSWPAFEAVEKTLEHDYRVLAEARRDETQPDRWQNIEAPVLVIDGEESFPFMQAGADWVAQGLSHASRKTLPGQTHQYDPKVVGPVVLAFLREIDLSG